MKNNLTIFDSLKKNLSNPFNYLRLEPSAMKVRVIERVYFLREKNLWSFNLQEGSSIPNL